MSSEESASGGNTIQLDTLSLDQLQQLQQQQEGRMQIFTNRYAQLRSAAARLQQSSIAVEELKAGQDDDTATATKEVFVPLTESVYVPGKIQLLQPDAKDLLVELGTGYFVEKTAQETQEYLERKMKLVDANSDNGAFIVVSIICIMLPSFVLTDIHSSQNNAFVFPVFDSRNSRSRNAEKFGVYRHGGTGKAHGDQRATTGSDPPRKGSS